MCKCKFINLHTEHAPLTSSLLSVWTPHHPSYVSSTKTLNPWWISIRVTPAAFRKKMNKCLDVAAGGRLLAKANVFQFQVLGNDISHGFSPWRVVGGFLQRDPEMVYWENPLRTMEKVLPFEGPKAWNACWCSRIQMYVWYTLETYLVPEVLLQE